MNFIDFLNNNLKFASTKTYGDILEEKSQENQIRSITNEKEFSEYQEYISGNKQRLLNECEITTNIETKPSQKKKIISGVGEVQQIY